MGPRSPRLHQECRMSRALAPPPHRRAAAFVAAGAVVLAAAATAPARADEPAAPTTAVSAVVVTRDAPAGQVAAVAADLRNDPGVVTVSVDTPVAGVGTVDTHRWLQWSLDALQMDTLP